ncbi:MAG: cache domain-containing protein [Verrucomicrobiota bacterium]
MLRIPQSIVGRIRVLHLLGWGFAALIVAGVMALGVGMARGVSAMYTEHDPCSLEVIRDSRMSALSAYFKEREDAMVLFAHSREVSGGLTAFSQAYAGVAQLVSGAPTTVADVWRQEVGRFIDQKSEKNGLPLPREEYLGHPSQALILQALYLAKSSEVAVAPETASYRYAYSVWNDALVRMADFGGLKDLMLVDLNGNVVYTARKGLDFAVNLKWNLHPNTGVRKVYDAAVQATEDSRVFQSDLVKSLFEPDSVSIHWAVPVFSGGKKIGVFMASRSSAELNQLMSAVEGLGRTGETYLVGEDFRMRSPSRVFGSSWVLKQEMCVELVKEALESGPIRRVDTNYRGVKALSVAAPLEMSGGRWVVISEMAYDEVMERVQALVRQIAWMGLGVLTCLLGSLYLAYRIVFRMLSETHIR